MLSLLLVAGAMGVALVPAPSSGVATVVASVHDGAWSDPATWSTGAVPSADQSVDIRDQVTFAGDASVAGVTVEDGAGLTWDGGTLHSTKNVVVNGTLTMHPADATVIDELQFTNVDESAFIGGGTVPIDTDVGLWVMGNGHLDLVGTAKRSWTNLTTSVAAGATTLTVNDATGWQPGDTIFVAPTKNPKVGVASFRGFDNATVTSVAGNSLTITPPLSTDHFRVARKWNAEVGNVTRNVKIEGTAAGFSHVFIHSTQPQTIRYAELAYLAPQPKSSTAEANGRYALHFHINGDASRGSIVEGVAVHDTKNHSLVAHASNGITFRDDLVYNVRGSAFWWDPKNKTHLIPTKDTTVDHVLIAREQQIKGSTGVREQAFRLGFGSGNSMTHSVAVGLDAGNESAGFSWLDNECGDGAWTFSDNVAHNNHEQGLFVWCNSADHHVINNYTAYFNTGKGIDAGAYYNSFTYTNFTLYGNAQAGLLVRAVAGAGNRQPTFTNALINCASVCPVAVMDGGHNNKADHGEKLTSFRMLGYSTAAVYFKLTTVVHQPGALDFINPTFIGNEFWFDVGVDPATIARVLSGTQVLYEVHPETYANGVLVPAWNARKVG